MSDMWRPVATPVIRKGTHVFNQFARVECASVPADHTGGNADKARHDRHRKEQRLDEGGLDERRAMTRITMGMSIRAGST
jgi:hypothetical protein